MICHAAFYVYVLINPQADIYIGHTNDLARRLQQHNDPIFHGTLHTKRHAGPWHLIHAEEYATRAQAMGREKQLKTSRGRAWIRKAGLTPHARV
jgi:putative endonuclease